MLAIYTSLTSQEISLSGTYTNPLSFFSPLSGDVQTVQLFAQSDNSNPENFSSVYLGVEDTMTPDNSGWFQFAQDLSGSPGTFATGRLSLNPIPYGTSMPFWMQVSIPTQTQIGTLNRFRLYVNYFVG